MTKVWALVAALLMIAGTSGAQTFHAIPGSTGGQTAITQDGGHVLFHNGTNCAIFDTATQAVEVVTSIETTDCVDIRRDIFSPFDLTFIANTASGTPVRMTKNSLGFWNFEGVGYDGHLGRLESIQQNDGPIGRYLTGGSAEGTLMTWRVGTGNILPSQQPGSFLGVSPDGAIVVGWEERIDNQRRNAVLMGSGGFLLPLPALSLGYGATAYAATRTAGQQNVAVGDSVQNRNRGGTSEEVLTATRWDGFAKSTLEGLGGYAASCPSTAFALNRAADRVVGSSCGAAVLWDQTDEATSVDSYLASTIGAPVGWTLSSTADVAIDANWIVGSGLDGVVPRNWALLTAHSPVGSVVDTDGDGILDGVDNCGVPNGPLAGDCSQVNFDSDAFGDACDADYDNNGVVTQSDFTHFFNSFSAGIPLTGDEDANCDGVVTIRDHAIFWNQFLKGTPGLP